MTHPDGFQVLVALDQLINTLIGGFADETTSLGSGISAFESGSGGRSGMMKSYAMSLPNTGSISIP